jgi:hypothetical protein
MADDSDPPRKFYGLKPTQFERVNRVPGADVPPPNASADLSSVGPASAVPPASAPGAPIDVRALVRQAQTGGPLLRGSQAAGPRNDVHAILRENLDRAEAAGLNAVAPPPRRKSRRRRDYFLLIVPLNVFLAFVAFGPFANPMTFVYGLAGMVLVTAGLTWIMFGVMDDY